MAIRGIKVHPNARRILLILGVVCCLATPNAIALPQDTLTLGQSVTNQLPGGKTHSFKISLTQGEFAEIHVEQHGAILLASLLDPQGGLVMETDFAGGGFGPIYLYTIAAAPGIYQLNIRSVNSWANTAPYDVTLTAQRPPTTNDRALDNGQQLFFQARKNARDGKFADAIDALKKSLTYWQAADDYHWQAVTQYTLSEAYGNRNREQAAQCLNETLRLLDQKMQPNDWRLKASALNNLGLINAYSGDAEERKRGVANLNAALALYAAHADRRGQASASGNLGGVYYNAGNMSLARELIDKAQAFRRAENDKPGAANQVNNLAAISDRLGDPEQALAYATQAVHDWEEVGELRPADKPRVASALTNLAAANDKLGHWDRALDFYDKALTQFDETDPARAYPLDNKGELYAALGDPIKARACYEDALKIMAAAGKPDLNLKAGILVHLGQLFEAQDDVVTALQYFEQARALSPEDPRLADVYTNLGAAFALKGDLDNAMKAYEDALKIQIRLNDQRGQAIALQHRGETYAHTGKPVEALNDFNKALGFWRAVKDRRGEASTLNRMAIVERDRGNFAAALAHSGEAIQIIESLRTGISNRQLQTSYFAGQENFYALDVDLKMQLGLKEKRTEYWAAALESAERARARVLLDILNEARLNQSEVQQQGNTRLAQLREDRVRCLAKLAAKNDARTRILSRAYDQQQIATLDREVDQLSDELDALEAKIRIEDPRFTGLTRPQPATLSDIQNELDANTILIEYFLGDARSYLWLVSRDSIDAVELPSRAQIEPLAEQVYTALSARGSRKKNESWEDYSARVRAAESNFTSASTSLSKMVLDQVGARLGNHRLVIVADGLLQTLPFGVLPAPLSAATPGASAANLPLLAKNEIINSPSASVLVLQRRELAQRKPAPYAVAVLADPVFDKFDARVAAAGSGRSRASSAQTLAPPAASKPETSPQTRALRDIGMNETAGIQRLVFSLQEARAIFSVADPKQTFKALDFKASRTTALSAELAKYRFIHIATHGILDRGHPELSGILFSMVDEKGQPQNGYVSLSEIYDLHLPAELIVLSACETGIGKQIRGEGLIALTRGFMHAGSRRVVASLWKVNDNATAELMGEFYRQMFVNKLAPAAALRAAQVKLAERNSWRNPHLWAGFVLQGEWR